MAKTAKKIAPAAPRPIGFFKKSLIEQILERQSSELVVAFCGPIGSGVTKVAEILQRCFETFGYESQYIKVSTLIGTNTPAEEKRTKLKENNFERVKRLQDEGNELRKNHGNDYLAQCVIQEIAIARKKWQKSNEESGNDTDLVKYRYVTVVDSLKNPDEVHLLKAVYGEMFYLFGVLCPESYRLERLQTAKKIPDEQARFLVNRDKEENFKHGQQLLKTIQFADFFVNNTHERADIIEQNIARYAKLILGDNQYSPTIHEYGMFLAQSAAMRSACLSRQVGASILSERGDVISTGRNDVPRSGGGIYTDADGVNDKRCLHREFCASDSEKEAIMTNIKERLIESIPVAFHDAVTENVFKAVDSLPRLQGLIEFSRAVHAEMDAITTAARNGNIGLLGSILYCTTYPCHHCARHIVASGIKTVYYIEPYEKSLALLLHGDSIASEAGHGGSKVQIIPFEGVAPKKYLELFSAAVRKRNGKRVPVDLSSAKPAIKKMLDPYIDYESKVVKMITDALEPK